MFYSLRDRILRLLFEAIENEADPVNLQMLLHGLLTMIQVVAFVFLLASERTTVESLLKDTPEIRTPLYKGHFAVFQVCFLSVNLPLK